MDYAFTYVEKSGIATEASYPYKAVQGKCKKETSVFKISKYTDITQSDCSSLLNALMIEPISIAADAENWSDYSSGIFSDCDKNLDHGILLVGYNQEDKYYIVKNSWGASWGE